MSEPDAHRQKQPDYRTLASYAGAFLMGAAALEFISWPVIVGAVLIAFVLEWLGSWIPSRPPEAGDIDD